MLIHFDSFFYFLLFVMLNAPVIAFGPPGIAWPPLGLRSLAPSERGLICLCGTDLPECPALPQPQLNPCSFPGLSLLQPCGWKSSPALPQGASGKRRRSAPSEPFAEDPARRLRLPWLCLRGVELSPLVCGYLSMWICSSSSICSGQGQSWGSDRAASIPVGSQLCLGCPAKLRGYVEGGRRGITRPRVLGVELLSSRCGVPGSREFNCVHWSSGRADAISRAVLAAGHGPSARAAATGPGGEQELGAEQAL